MLCCVCVLFVGVVRVGVDCCCCIFHTHAAIHAHMHTYTHKSTHIPCITPRHPHPHPKNNRLAMHAAHGLATAGLPLLALQALQIAREITPTPTHMAVQHTRRNTLCRIALRAVLSAMPGVLSGVGVGGAGGGGDGFVQGVVRQLRSMQEAGVGLHVDEATMVAEQLQVCLWG